MSSISVHQLLSDSNTNLSEVLAFVHRFFDEDIGKNVVNWSADEKNHTSVMKHGADLWMSYTPLSDGTFIISSKGRIGITTLERYTGNPTSIKLDVNLVLDSHDPEAAYFQLSTLHDMVGLEWRDIERITDLMKKMRKHLGQSVKE